jgi:hypothetical protein
MDDTQDRQDGRWLTYAELAAIRGIGRASAVKLVQRERWPRSSGNDRARTVRVLVPPDWLAPAKERPASSDAPAMSGEYPGMMAGALAALEDAVAGLRGQLDVANARAERAEARADALRDRADELQAGQELMMDMHARALAAAQDQLERVREAAEGLRDAEQERRARGLLARLRAAVRGE